MVIVSRCVLCCIIVPVLASSSYISVNDSCLVYFFLSDSSPKNENLLKIDTTIKSSKIYMSLFLHLNSLPAFEGFVKCWIVIIQELRHPSRGITIFLDQYSKLKIIHFPISFSKYGAGVFISLYLWRKPTVFRKFSISFSLHLACNCLIKQRLWAERCFVNSRYWGNLYFSRSKSANWISRALWFPRCRKHGRNRGIQS